MIHWFHFSNALCMFLIKIVNFKTYLFELVNCVYEFHIYNVFNILERSNVFHVHALGCYFFFYKIQHNFFSLVVNNSFWFFIFISNFVYEGVFANFNAFGHDYWCHEFVSSLPQILFCQISIFKAHCMPIFISFL